MKTKLKKFGAWLMAAALAFAGAGAVQAAGVAKVGDTEYETIDEAITAWEANDSTMTLMADVTLPRAVKFLSTTTHTLNLASYMMTAASKQNAIEITPNGRSSAGSCLTINADGLAGKIYAPGKYCVYYYAASGKDRPIITFNNGTFEGDSVVSVSKTNGTNCPQLIFNNGLFIGTSLFNGCVNSNRSLIQVNGGDFRGRFYISADTSAYCRIGGGIFDSIPSTWDATPAKDKFCYATTKTEASDVFVYFNEEDRFVVSKTLPECGASLPTPKSGTLARFGKPQVYFKNPACALEKIFDVSFPWSGSSQTITLYADADQPKALSSGQSLTVILENGAKYDAATLITSSTKGYKITPTVVDEKTTKYVCELDLEAAEAKIGEKYYATANEAVSAAKSGQAITFLRGECTQAKTLKDGETLTLIFVDGTYDYDTSVTPETGCKIEKEMWDSGKTVVLSCAVDPAQCVARIGDTHYTTLAKAVSGAKGGDTIVLERDIDLGESRVTISKNLTLDLNGHAIAYAYKYGCPIYVSGAYVFGLIDSVGTGSVCNSASYGNSSYSVIRAYSGATINISGGAYSSKANLFDITVASTVNISGGTFAGTLTCGTGSTLSISGGTFDHDPEGFVAEGCMKVKNDDGTWSVCAAGVVAIVGGTPFHSLAEAVEAAADGATVKVVGAATDAATVGKNLVLAIAEGATCASAITVADGKTLTVSDGARFDGKVFANGGTVEFQGLGDKVKGYNEDGSISVKDASGVVAKVDDAGYFDAGKAVADWAAGTVLTLNAAAEDDAVVSAEKKLVLGEQGRFAGKIVLEGEGKLTIENAVSADNVIRFTGCVAAETLADVVTAEMPAGFHFASNGDGTWLVFAPGVRAEATTTAAVKEDVTAVDPQGQQVDNPGTEAAAKIETISEKVAESMKADLSESNNEILKGTITDETGKLDNKILAELREKAVEVGVATPETVDEVIPETVETDPFAKVSKPLTKVVVEGEKVELDFVAYEVHPVVQKIVGEKTIEVPVSNEMLAENNTYLDFSVPVTVLPEDENEWVLIDHSTDGGHTFKPYDCTKIEKDADGKAKTKTLWSKEFSLWATKTSPTKLVRNLQRSGTAADPFLIRDKDDLVFFRDQVNAGKQEYAGAGVYVKLDADIDLSTIENWEPIGRNAMDENADVVKGYFDGNGKTISNLKIDSSEERIGLFGNIWNGDNAGWIKDLTVSNATVSSSGRYVGSLIGYGQGYTISNCRIIDGSVSAADQVGGLGGTLLACKVEGTTVENVTVTATVDRAGGIAGKVQYGCEIVGNTVKGCTITAANAVSGHDSAAGLVAQVIPRTEGKMDPNTISDNEILGVTTKTAGVESVTPICNYREGTDYGDDPLSKSTISRNHWDPETNPDETVVHYEGGSVTIPNFHPVAQIEGKGLAARYETIQAALDAAAAGDTVQLLCDVTLNNNGDTFGFSKSQTLDFNGNKLLLRGQAGFAVGNDVQIVLKNGTLDVSETSGRATSDSLGATGTVIYFWGGSQTTLKDVSFVGANITASYILQLSHSGGASSLEFDHSTLAIDGCKAFANLGNNCSVSISEESALSFKKLSLYNYVFGDGNQTQSASVSIKDSSLEIVNDGVVQHRGFGFLGAVTLDNSAVTVKNLGEVAFRSCNVELTNNSRILVDNNTDWPINGCKFIVNDGCILDVENSANSGMNLANGSIFKAGSTVVVSNCCMSGTNVGKNIGIRSDGSLTIEKNANVFCYGNLVDQNGTATIAVADGRYDKLVQNGATTKFDVTGGIYKESPNPAFVSKKAVVVNNIDPETMAAYPFRVERLPDVAQIGDEKYVSLQEACEAAYAAGTDVVITLLADIEETDLVLTKWKGYYSEACNYNVTFDFNDHELKVSSFETLIGSDDVKVVFSNGTINVSGAVGKKMQFEDPTCVFDVLQHGTLEFTDMKIVGSGVTASTIFLTFTANNPKLRFIDCEIDIDGCNRFAQVDGGSVEFVDSTVTIANQSSNGCFMDNANGVGSMSFLRSTVALMDSKKGFVQLGAVTLDASTVALTNLSSYCAQGSNIELKNGSRLLGVGCADGIYDGTRTNKYEHSTLVVGAGCEVNLDNGCEIALKYGASNFGADSTVVAASITVDGIATPLSAASLTVAKDANVTVSGAVSSKNGAVVAIADGRYGSVQQTDATASGAVDLTGGIYTVRPEDSYVVNPAYGVFDNDDEATKATHQYRVAAKPEIVEMYNGDGTPFGKTYSLELGFKNVPAGGKILLVGACDESFTTDRIDGFMFQIKEGVIYDVSKITLPNGYALKDKGNGSYSYYKMPIATITHGSEVFEYASLSEACTAAVSGDTIVLSPMIIDAISETAIAGLNNKSVVVKGAGMDATTLNWGTGKKTGPSGADFGTAEIMFQDLAFTVDHANGEPYKEHFKPMASLAFTGVKVNGMLVVDNDATFDGCTFMGPRYNSKTAADDQYLLWLYKGKLTVVNCTFAGTGTHAPIKLYSEPDMPDNVCALEISNCTFAVVGDQNGAIVSSCKHTTSRRPQSKDQVYDVQIDTDSVTIPDGAYYVGLETGSSAAYGVTIINGTKDKNGKYVSGAVFSSVGTDEDVNRIVGLFISADSVCLPYEGPETNLADFHWYIGDKQVEPKTDDVEVGGVPQDAPTEVKQQVAADTNNVIKTLSGDDITKFADTDVAGASFDDNGTPKTAVKQALVDAASEPAVKDAIEAQLGESNSNERVEIKLDKFEFTVQEASATLSIVEYDVKPIIKVTTVVGGVEKVTEAVIPNEALVGHPLTFRLAVNSNFVNYAKVTHKHDDTVLETYLTEVFTGVTGKYVQLKSDHFSNFFLSADVTEPKCKVGDQFYNSVQEAIEENADVPDAVFTLTAPCEETNLPLKWGQVIDVNGQQFTGSITPAADPAAEFPPAAYEQAKTPGGLVFSAPTQTVVSVGAPEDNLSIKVRMLGYSAAELAAGQGNGRPLWQNLAMGIGDVKLIPMIPRSAIGVKTITIRSNLSDEAVEAAAKVRDGVSVQYQLLKKAGAGDYVQCGAVTNTPVFTVEADELEPRTFWKIQTIFSEEY